MSDSPPQAGQSFDDFDLPGPVREGLQAANFTHCTPIQEKVLPISLVGKDIAGQAQTGTGKTAAFLLTVFARLLATEGPGKPGAPRALIIAPTRELVVQIANDAMLLGDTTGLSIQAVYGGVDYKKQREDVLAGVDVLIGTPGRLIDYHKQRVYDLRKTEMLVIDEADRMFDMGFIKDLRYLLRQLPPPGERQSMLFSATLSWDVMELAYVFMHEPERVEIAPEQVTAENVEHIVYHVGIPEKLPVLVNLLRQWPDGRVLIFVNMKRTAERLEQVLSANGMPGAALTGDVDQRKRLRLLAEFKDGRLPILVATDVASRGLHIDGVTHVVNFDLPQDAEDYVHRVGRTARAGASGTAVSLACEDHVQSLGPIQEYIGFKLPFEFPADDMISTRITIPPRPPRRPRDGRGGSFGDRGPRSGPGDRRSPGGPRPRRSDAPRSRGDAPRGEDAPASPRAEDAGSPPRAEDGPTPPASPVSSAPSNADGTSPAKKRRRRRKPGSASSGPGA